jgi:hypothetical protein
MAHVGTSDPVNATSLMIGNLFTSMPIRFVQGTGDAGQVNGDRSWTFLGSTPGTPAAGQVLVGGGKIKAVDSVTAPQYVGDQTSVSLATINTWYALPIGSLSGVVVIRDITNGGIGMFFVEGSGAVSTVSSTMAAGFEIRHTGSAIEGRFTSGSARSIRSVILSPSA